MKKFSAAFSKINVVVAWCVSPAGRKDIGAFIAAATALYVALHRAGV